MWANSRDQAIDHVDGVIGKPDIHSMMPLASLPGCICFNAEIETVCEDNFYPIFIFGKGCLYFEDDKVSEWMVERIRNPFKGAKKVSADTEMPEIVQPVKSRNMKIWIGHKCEDEKKWFIVWVNSKDQVLICLDGEDRDPDVQSMRLLDTPGCVCFKAEIEEDEGNFHLVFTFDRNSLSFDDDKPCKWVVERIKRERDKRQKAIENFSCQRCGRCCKGSIVKSISATYDNLKKWRDLGRDDILRYCRLSLRDGRCINGIYWDGQPILGCDMFDGGNPLKCCPFLQKVDNKDIYKCGIHDIKPEVCREYPNNGICLRIKEENIS
ncbi:hypothetical protein ES703_115686 [subsurface metagenome]